MGTYSPTVLQQVIKIDWIIMVHYFEYTAELAFSGESHNFWEFVYVVDGSVLIEADGAPHILKKGEVIFHQPNGFHTIRSYNGSCPKLIIISFVSDSPAMDEFRHKQVTVNPEDSKLLVNLLKEAQRAFSTKLHTPMDNAYLTSNQDAPFGSEQLVGLYLQHFLICLIRHSNPEILSHTSTFRFDSQLPHSQNPRVEETIQLLSHNITRPLQMRDICYTIGISRSRLQQLFNLEFQCGVMEFFLRLKATAAKQMLLQKDSNITDIAEELGFSSPAYFSAFFKKYFGCTPSQYRKATLDITKSVFDLS